VEKLPWETPIVIPPGSSMTFAIVIPDYGFLLQRLYDDANWARGRRRRLARRELRLSW
jgi:hypothetical protein